MNKIFNISIVNKAELQKIDKHKETYLNEKAKKNYIITSKNRINNTLHDYLIKHNIKNVIIKGVTFNKWEIWEKKLNIIIPLASRYKMIFIDCIFQHITIKNIDDNIDNTEFINCVFYVVNIRNNRNLKFNKCYFHSMSLDIYVQMNRTCSFNCCIFEETIFLCNLFCTVKNSILKNWCGIKENTEFTLINSQIYGKVLTSESYIPNLYDCTIDQYIPDYLPEGKFIAYKKILNNKGERILCKLEIPKDALRSRGVGDKCRASKAKVLGFETLKGDILNIEEGKSIYNSSFKYRINEIVSSEFDEDRWQKCGKGIHFFINKQSAIAYDI